MTEDLGTLWPAVREAPASETTTVIVWLVLAATPVDETITVVVSDARTSRTSGQSVPRSLIKAYNWSEH